MAIDETVCDEHSSNMEQAAAASVVVNFGQPASSSMAAAVNGQIDAESSNPYSSAGKISSLEAATTKQPIGAAATTTVAHTAQPTHLSTFVGSASNTSAKFHEITSVNDDVNKQNLGTIICGGEPQFDAGAGAAASTKREASLKSAKNSSARASLSQPKQQQQQSQQLLRLSQSQTRINHSLESINSRYSTSSANDDSASMQPSSQQKQQQHQQQHLHQQNKQQQHEHLHLQRGGLDEPRQSPLRHRMSASQASSCSPIEAQLASSTCDLGINLMDSGGAWRGSSFSGLSSTPTRQPSKSLVAFISLLDKTPPPPQDDDPRRSSGGQLKDPNNNNNNDVKQTQDKQPEEVKPPFMFAGVLASIVGSVFFSLSVLCIKLLPNQEGFSEKVKALCFRGSFVSLLCGATILIQRGTFIVRRDELFVNILRAVLGTLGVLGLYCALSYINMGDATALVFSSPVWTSILSHFILHEPLQWLQLVALPASLFGIVLIAHPGLIFDVEHHQQQQQQLQNPHASGLNDSTSQLVAFSIQNTPDNQTSSSYGNNQSLLLLDHATPQLVSETSSFDFEHRWPGIVIALATSLLVSCVYITLKFRKTTPIQTTTFWLGVCMFLSSLALQLFTGPIDIPLTLFEWALLFGNGVTSWLGQSFLQWAFLYEEAGVLSIVRTLDVAMSFILSAMFLEEEILWTSIVGATIIGLVVASIMLNEWLKKLFCSDKGDNNFVEDDEQEVAGVVGVDKKNQLSSKLSIIGPVKSTKFQQQSKDHSHFKQSAYMVAASKA